MRRQSPPCNCPLQLNTYLIYSNSLNSYKAVTCGRHILFFSTCMLCLEELKSIIYRPLSSKGLGKGCSQWLPQLCGSSHPDRVCLCVSRHPVGFICQGVNIGHCLALRNTSATEFKLCKSQRDVGINIFSPVHCSLYISCCDAPKRLLEVSLKRSNSLTENSVCLHAVLCAAVELRDNTRDDET